MKKHKNYDIKKHKRKEVTKETVIIVGLVCFIAGYAVNAIIGSFNSPRIVSGTGITQPQVTNSPVQSQTELLKERLNTNPEDVSTWINLGNSYFDSDRYEQAIDAYLKALELEPNNSDVLSDLGVMYRRSGKPKKAISTFDEGLRVDSSHTMSLFNKGIVLFYDLDRKNEAIETWTLLASIDPNFRMPKGELITDFLDTVN